MVGTKVGTELRWRTFGHPTPFGAAFPLSQVPRTVEDVVRTLVAGQPRLDEGPQRQGVQKMPIRTANGTEFGVGSRRP